jgi:hypothetical protein
LTEKAGYGTKKKGYCICAAPLLDQDKWGGACCQTVALDRFFPYLDGSAALDWGCYRPFCKEIIFAWSTGSKKTGGLTLANASEHSYLSASTLSQLNI